MADRRVDLEDGEITRLGVNTSQGWVYAHQRGPWPARQALRQNHPPNGAGRTA
jgi:hypothetical protein